MNQGKGLKISPFWLDFVPACLLKTQPTPFATSPSQKYEFKTTPSSLSYSLLALSSSAMTVLLDIHDGQTPLLAVGDSRSVGAGICCRQQCPFPPEKQGSPSARANFDVWKYHAA